MKECKFIQDFEYISNKEEKDNNSVFLYLLYKSDNSSESGQQNNLNHESRFTHLIQ